MNQFGREIWYAQKSIDYGEIGASLAKMVDELAEGVTSRGGSELLEAAGKINCLGEETDRKVRAVKWFTIGMKVGMEAYVESLVIKVLKSSSGPIWGSSSST